MNTDTPGLPTPHLDKLKALLNNRRLPAADKPLYKITGSINKKEEIKGEEGERGERDRHNAALNLFRNKFVVIREIDKLCLAPELSPELPES